MPTAGGPFDQGSQVACITTRQVLTAGLPILQVTHYSDADEWALVCDTTGAWDADGRISAVEPALKLDPTLRTIADLPPGWSAWRE